MIRTTLVGSWPPLERFSSQLHRYHRRELPEDECESLLREVATVAILQQKHTRVDEYTGGETSADSFILQFPRWLAGIERTGDLDAWSGRGEYRTVGPISARNGLGLATAFRRERDIDPTISKVTIPGPSEITMMIEPPEAQPTLYPAVIDIIRREIGEFVEAGATDVQLDAPHIAMGLADGQWETQRAVEVIRRIFDGIRGVKRSLHLCYGDFGARTWVRNRSFHPLLETIQALDGVIDRLVLELSLPEQWAERALLSEVPASMEIAAGIIDVKDSRVESLEEIRAKLRELLNHVPARRLLVCPSCGLGRRNTQMAIDKCKAMVRAVRLVNATD